MCVELDCGSECKYDSMPDAFVCNRNPMHQTQYPDYGYYPRDVEGVTEKMKAWAAQMMSPRTRATVMGWIHELETK